MSTSGSTLQTSLYHKMLRVALLVCAVVLLFESGLVTSATVPLASETHRYLANVVGMSAAVQPTELNQYTAELTARERLLDEREAALKQREITISSQQGPGDTRVATYTTASILFILLLLIVLNYTLDYVRAIERRPV